ncbi:MAG: aminotransferase class V-fold PLP-dependent enzyme [Acidobacteriota bacterium]
MSDADLLRRAAEIALGFLDGLPDRRVGQAASADELRSALGGPLPDRGEAPAAVLEHLARGADPGLVAMAGPRYFGFVIGGHLPAALAADWLTSTWDQNATLYVTSPANSVAEEVSSAWLLDLLGLPATASVGFVTGAQMANFTCLAAARHEVLRQAGWDVEANGLFGAPEIDVVLGADAHVTVLIALQMLGLGRQRVRRVETDGQGRMKADSLRAVLREGSGPLIVCAAAGNVNTGAFDPLEEVVAAARERGAWVHVDGAFGLWAAAAPGLRDLVRGAGGADSWAVDAHKWLNVPYDCGLAIVANPRAHKTSMTAAASYIPPSESQRDPYDFTPEFSRRARGFTVWAALRSLGRSGVGELVERCCALARRMADRLRGEPGVEILNDVVLNQVLVRFGDSDDQTREVIRRVQEEGTCWLGGSTWRGRAAMRVSVSNWSTTEADVDVSAEAILSSYRGSGSRISPSGPSRG